MSNNRFEPIPSNVKGIVMVLLVHVLIIYALVSGLARKVITNVTQPIMAQVIPPKLKEKMVQPAQQKPNQPVNKTSEPVDPPVFVAKSTNTPKIESSIVASDVEPNKQIESKSESVPTQKVEPKVEATPVKTAASTGVRSGCAEPQYPEDALANEEAGTVVLAMLIGPNGNVLDSKVKKSSGSKTLDTAALKALSLCKFKPATSDGKPVEEWANLSYQWRLQ